MAGLAERRLDPDATGPDSLGYDPFRAAALELFSGTLRRILSDAGYDEARLATVIGKIEGDLDGLLSPDRVTPDCDRTANGVSHEHGAAEAKNP